MKACIFARLPAKKDLERGFYATDVRILREKFSEVVPATSVGEAPRDCDLYLAWWWTTAAIPLLISAVFGAGPVVVTGNFDFDSPPRGTGAIYVERPWWQRWLCRFALAGGDANLFLSDDEYRRIPSLLYTHNAARVYLAVDLEQHKPGSGPRKPFILNIAWSGKFNAMRKCLFEIIEAMPLILREQPDIRLVMGGFEGEALPRMKERAAELGVSSNIDFIGTIDGPTIVRLMQECSVYVSPTKHEGFGLALAEAMACGAPVVTSDRGGSLEAVGDAAVLVEPEPVSIAAGVNRLLADPRLRDDLSSRGRERVVRLYAYDRRARELGEIMDTAMRDRSRRGSVAMRCFRLAVLIARTAPLFHRFLLPPAVQSGVLGTS